jgi:hypothetical protein
MLRAVHGLWKLALAGLQVSGVKRVVSSIVKRGRRKGFITDRKRQQHILGVFYKEEKETKAITKKLNV